MTTDVEYEEYVDKQRKLIRTLLSDIGSRPVLFVGSGLSRRYLNGPSWTELLAKIASRTSVSNDRFAFLSQKAGGDAIELGTLLSDEVHTWAFGPGKNNFPADFFLPGADQDNFIKSVAASIVEELTTNIDNLECSLMEELESFKKISPHAIITTNFDQFLEISYPDFELIVGEQIIPLSLTITGELYKIHGTSATPSSLILTRRDFDRFISKRKYITSKLMTYFAEYPVFFFGYSFSDTNINEIVSDLGEAIRDKGGLLENVFLVKRIRDLGAVMSLQEEHAVPARDPHSAGLRVRTILTKDFQWIFDELGNTANPLPVPISTLRHLASRVVDLVRVDIPKSKIEVNFDQLKGLTSDPEKLAMVLGIGNVSSPSMSHPYSPTDLGKALGFKGWHSANKLIEIANKEIGNDIKSSDNEYHISVAVGSGSSRYHKYSKKLLDILVSIRDR